MIAFQLLTYWGQDKVVATFQKTFSYVFSWIKLYEMRLRFHWRIFPKFTINNIPALDQLMARSRPGDKPLSEPKMVRLPTHICVTQPQWFDIPPTYFFIFPEANAEWNEWGIVQMMHCVYDTKAGRKLYCDRKVSQCGIVGGIGDDNFYWLWPTDAIWCRSFGSTLAQVMAWCHQAAFPEPMLTDYPRYPVSFIRM